MMARLNYSRKTNNYTCAMYVVKVYYVNSLGESMNN